MAVSVLGHGLVDYLMVMGMSLFALFAGFTKTKRVLYIIPAAITFYFFIDFLTLLTPIKLVPPLFLGAVLLKGDYDYFSISKGRSWFAYVLCLIAISFLIGFVYSRFLPTFGSYSVMKRLLIQAVSYVNVVLIYLILRKECREPSQFFLFLRVYVITTSILCLYGVYQLIAYKWGLPFRGIVYDADTALAAVNLENQIFRINSLANEPKRLSYVLIVSIVILITYVQQFSLSTRRKLFVFFLMTVHLVCAWLTYSTSIYISLAIFLFVIVLSSLWQKQYRVYSRYAVLGLLVFILALPFFYERLLIIYQARVIDAVTGLGGYYVRIEEYAFPYLLQHPHLLIAGVGMGLYNFFLANDLGMGFGLSRYGLIPMNSAMLTYVFDFGLPGTIILFSPLLKSYLGLNWFKNAFADRLAFPMLLLFFSVSLTLNPTFLYFAFLGVLDSQRLSAT